MFHSDRKSIEYSGYWRKLNCALSLDERHNRESRKLGLGTEQHDRECRRIITFVVLLVQIVQHSSYDVPEMALSISDESAG